MEQPFNYTSMFFMFSMSPWSERSKVHFYSSKWQFLCHACLRRSVVNVSGQPTRPYLTSLSQGPQMLWNSL